MDEDRARQIASEHYKDESPQLFRDGERGWVFRPSPLRSGWGQETLIIDKQTGALYTIPSGFIAFYELALEDFDARSGLFEWPDEGGCPNPDRTKLALRQAEDARALLPTATEEEAVHCACLLAEVARNIYLFKLNDHERAEIQFREAVEVQRKHVQRFSDSSSSPVGMYVWYLNRQKRFDEASQLELEFQALRQSVQSRQPQTTAGKGATGVKDEIIKRGTHLLERALDAEEGRHPDEAVRLYRQGIEVLLQAERSEETDFGLLMGYHALGSLLHQSGQYQQTLDVLRRAIELYQSSANKGPLRMITQANVEILAECLTKLGRKDDLARLTSAGADGF